MHLIQVLYKIFEIRDAICDVMEGGREALEGRYYRITKALE